MDTFKLLLSSLWRRALCIALGHKWARTAYVTAKWKGWRAYHCPRCHADRFSLDKVNVVEWSLWR